MGASLLPGFCIRFILDRARAQIPISGAFTAILGHDVAAPSFPSTMQNMMQSEGEDTAIGRDLARISARRATLLATSANQS